MAFIQKDRNSRKDKLEQAATAPPREPRVVIHKTKDGKQHLHFDLPVGAASKESHLEDLLAKLEARASEESPED